MLVMKLLLLLHFFIIVYSFDFDSFYNEIQNKLNENSSILKSFQNLTTNFSSKRYELLVRTYSEKIIKAGFRFEEHKVITDDGYILSVWRIPGPLRYFSKIHKKPVILQHGLLDDSYTFLALNFNISLPLLLAREGYIKC